MRSAGSMPCQTISAPTTSETTINRTATASGDPPKKRFTEAFLKRFPLSETMSFMASFRSCSGRLNLARGDNRLCATLNIEFHQYRRNMCLNCGLGYGKFICDLFIEQTFRKHHQHAHLL